MWEEGSFHDITSLKAHFSVPVIQQTSHGAPGYLAVPPPQVTVSTTSKYHQVNFEVRA